MAKRQRFTKEFKVERFGCGNPPVDRQPQSPASWAYGATICISGRPTSTTMARPRPLAKAAGPIVRMT